MTRVRQAEVAGVSTTRPSSGYELSVRWSPEQGATTRPAESVTEAQATSAARLLRALTAPREPRDDLSGWDRALCLLVIAVSFSATNFFFLSVFSAHLGAMAKRWNSAFVLDARDTSYEVRRFYITASLRGFLVYAVILSGSLVFGTERTFNDVSQGQYLKLAGLITAIAFLCGYEPRVFARLMRTLEDALEDRGGLALPSATGKKADAAEGSGAGRVDANQDASRPEGHQTRTGKGP